MEKTIHLNEYEEDANENSNEISENIKFENEFNKFFKKKHDGISVNIYNTLKHSKLVIDNPIQFCLLVCD
jgi:protein involved in sex pheromone biosynthesis